MYLASTSIFEGHEFDLMQVGSNLKEKSKKLVEQVGFSNLICKTWSSKFVKIENIL